MKKTEKLVKKYAAMYQSALLRAGVGGAAQRAQSYAARLTDMYVSDAYRQHDRYPSMLVPLVYAVIAMCLELKDAGLQNGEIIDLVNDVFRTRKRALGCLERGVDLFPFAWTIVRKWNLADHESRLKDGSITFDSFQADADRVSYRISRCMYAEMFDFYGIRALCKIFCMTDTQAYANLTRHVRFVRHSDLADGDCCHDDVCKVKKIKALAVRKCF